MEVENARTASPKCGTLISLLLFSISSYSSFYSVYNPSKKKESTSPSLITCEPRLLSPFPHSMAQSPRTPTEVCRTVTRSESESESDRNGNRFPLRNVKGEEKVSWYFDSPMSFFFLYFFISKISWSANKLIVGGSKKCKSQSNKVKKRISKTDKLTRITLSLSSSK